MMEEEKTPEPSLETSRTANMVVLTILGVIFLSLFLFFVLKMPKIIKSPFGKRLKTMLIFLFFSIGILFRIIFSLHYFMNFPHTVLAILRPLPMIFYTLSTCTLSYYLLKSVLLMHFQHQTPSHSQETINSQLLQSKEVKLKSNSKWCRITKTKLIYVFYFMTLGMHTLLNGLVCLPLSIKQQISEFAILLVFTILSFLMAMWFYGILIALYYVMRNYYPFSFKEFQITRIVFFCTMIGFAILFNFIAYLLIVCDFKAFHSFMLSQPFHSAIPSSLIILMLGVFFFICRELIPMLFLMKYFLKQSQIYSTIKNSKNSNCNLVFKRRRSSGRIESVVKYSDYEGINQNQCEGIINDTNFRDKSTEFSEQQNHNSIVWKEEKQGINEIEEDIESQFSFVSLVVDSYTQQMIENDSYLQHKFVISYM